MIVSPVNTSMGEVHVGQPSELHSDERKEPEVSIGENRATLARKEKHVADEKREPYRRIRNAQDQERSEERALKHSAQAPVIEIRREHQSGENGGPHVFHAGKFSNAMNNWNDFRTTG